MRLNAPPGRGDRGARAAPCSRVAALARGARLARRPRRAPRRGRGASRCSPRRLRRRPPRRGAAALDVVATTTQLGDLARDVGGDAVDVHQILQPNTDPHEYEPRRRRDATAGATRRARERRRARRLDGQGRRRRPAAARRSSSSAPCRSPGQAGADASRVDPHWWHDPRERGVPPSGAIRDALARADPPHGAPLRPPPRAYLAQLRALDARHRALHRPRARAPSASSSPTTTPSATSPRATGSARRRGDPVPDDAGPALGGRARELIAT